LSTTGSENQKINADDLKTHLSIKKLSKIENTKHFIHHIILENEIKRKFLRSGDVRAFIMGLIQI